MRIGFMASEAGFPFAEYLRGYLTAQGYVIEYINDECTTSDIEAINVAVSIGGDGTVLRLARLVDEKPIFGINHGHLGFLTDIEKDVSHVGRAFKDIEQGNYRIDRRSRLEATVIAVDGNMLRSTTALNDIVFKRRDGSMAKINVYVGDDAIGHFPADGLIIASPTGSTGYSLSAGGPVVPPDVNAHIITPICSHSLNARAVIVNDTHPIRVHFHSEMGYRQTNAYLQADGAQHEIDLAFDDEIIIKKAKSYTNLIRVIDMPFFSVMSNKLNWA